MDNINLRYILTRAGGVILAIVVALYVMGYVKKKNKHSALVSELKSLSSDSSFFGQFYAEDAQKSLIKAVGLIAEANKLGLAPEEAINRGLGIEEICALVRGGIIEEIAGLLFCEGLGG